MLSGQQSRASLTHECPSGSKVFFEGGEFGAIIVEDSLDDSYFEVLLDADEGQYSIIADALIESRRVLHSMTLEVKSLEFQEKKVHRNIVKLLANFSILEGLL